MFLGCILLLCNSHLLCVSTLHVIFSVIITKSEPLALYVKDRCPGAKLCPRQNYFINHICIYLKLICHSVVNHLLYGCVGGLGSEHNFAVLGIFDSFIPNNYFLNSFLLTSQKNVYLRPSLLVSPSLSVQFTIERQLKTWMLAQTYLNLLNICIRVNCLLLF